jgi:DNA-binding MarR family transcriptional regulator
MSNERPQIVDDWTAGLSEKRMKLLQELIQVNRAYQTAVEKMDSAFFESLGVNRTDGRCLDVIDQRPGITAGELAAAVGLSPGAVTTALDRLEARGFVTRERDERDRRRVTLKLTAEANRLAWEAYGPLGQMGRPFIERMSDRDIAAIVKFLRGGAEINEQRAGEILEAARPPGPSAPEAGATP